ncbi:hypothetical protein EA663_18855 [Pseudoxanthomonas winnipegensis]|nr:hypothetical protein EA663_18855 [Pseudoxanthomonas winnipegensis]
MRRCRKSPDTWSGCTARRRRCFNAAARRRDSGFGIRDSGFGNRESGIGNRESGIGNRESGIDQELAGSDLA